MITKIELDKLADKYENEYFINSDPVKIPHMFKTKEDIEIAGFISSLIAYGSRKVFIKKLDQLFEIAQNEPLNFILNFEKGILGDFNYRFGKTEDFDNIFKVMKGLYSKDGGLEDLFKYAFDTVGTLKNPNFFKIITDYFYSRVQNGAGQGFYFMIPNPDNGGAMKRMNMFLRWMVRKPPVDFGIWKCIPQSELLIPLDVHVARVSREMGLLTRNSNDFKAVIELTENLKKYNPDDPVRYDFATFGYGVNNSTK
ncbi:TIGR02757 family protein [bacterium]|nr:TIGR02757 family protein [bacterium]